MSDAARAGVFQYAAGGTVRSMNVLDLAARSGQISTIDPTIGKLLADIAAVAKSTGTLTPNADPNSSTLVFASPSLSTRHLPTTRLDFNLRPTERLTGTY